MRGREAEERAKERKGLGWEKREEKEQGGGREKRPREEKKKSAVSKK